MFDILETATDEGLMFTMECYNLQPHSLWISMRHFVWNRRCS